MSIKYSDFYIRVTDKWHLNDEVYEYQINRKLVPHEHSEEQNEKIMLYNRILSDSRYSLCPVGAGPNTLRFWESIAIGSIPVFFNNEFIPPFFNEFVDNKEENIEMDSVFVYVDANPSISLSIRKKLDSIGSEECQKRSHLCQQYYMFVKRKTCFD